MVHAGYVFVAGIHPSRTWMSGSFESVRWKACVHRLDLGSYSHPKEFGGMESEPILTPREKSPLPGKKILRGGSNPRRCIKQESEANTLPTSYSGPLRRFVSVYFEVSPVFASLLTGKTGLQRSSSASRNLHLLFWQSRFSYSPMSPTKYQRRTRDTCPTTSPGPLPLSTVHWFEVSRQDSNHGHNPYTYTPTGSRLRRSSLRPLA